MERARGRVSNGLKHQEIRKAFSRLVRNVFFEVAPRTSQVIYREKVIPPGRCDPHLLYHITSVHTFGPAMLLPSCCGLILVICCEMIQPVYDLHRYASVWSASFPKLQSECWQGIGCFDARGFETSSLNQEGLEETTPEMSAKAAINFCRLAFIFTKLMQLLS